MRSSLPSPSLSKLDSTHTSPLTQSAGVAEKTFCDMPLANVGTAGAGTGAAIAPGAAAVAAFGGRAEAGLVATTPASAIVTVTALAHAKRFPLYIPDPSFMTRFARSLFGARARGKRQVCCRVR